MPDWFRDPDGALDVSHWLRYGIFALDGQAIERNGILSRSINRFVARRERY
jgi:hypothetical protein